MAVMTRSKEQFLVHRRRRPLLRPSFWTLFLLGVIGVLLLIYWGRNLWYDGGSYDEQYKQMKNHFPALNHPPDHFDLENKDDSSSVGFVIKGRSDPDQKKCLLEIRKVLDADEIAASLDVLLCSTATPRPTKTRTTNDNIVVLADLVRSDRQKIQQLERNVSRLSMSPPGVSEEGIEYSLQESGHESGQLSDGMMEAKILTMRDDGRP
eukprot:scaffold421296_cov63-Attheya_sp.AAC.1